MVALLLTAGRPLHEEFRNDDFPPNVVLHFAPAQTAGRVRRAWWERAKLPRLVDELDVEVIVQLNGMTVPGLGDRTLAHFGDPWPYLPEAWNEWYDPALALLRRRAHQRSLRSARWTSFTSDWLRQLICRRNRVPIRGEVLHNGVPVAWAERPRNANEAAQSPAERTFRLVTVGNVSPYKRQEQVMRVLPRLYERLRQRGIHLRPKYHVLGYCDGAYHARLVTLIRDLGLCEDVALEGRVPNERIEELLADSRCFALMSVCESFGIPVIEAMSFGCPTVVANAAALPEIAGDAAELVPADDDDALVAALLKVLTDDAHAADLQRRGFANVVPFGWDETARQLDALISG